ncbi:MAG: hypothetical protein ACYS6W_09175 [Planctomycetota bacterium]|jgi:outer membrane lipoprotein-sorting protein
MNNDERQFENFVSNIKFDDTPDHNHRDTLEQDLLRAMAKQTPRQIWTWRTVMEKRIIKYAAAAVIAAIVLSGIAFWPDGGPENGKGGTGLSAAWARDILASLEKVEALVYREQHVVSGGDYGPTKVTRWSERRYCAKSAYRKDVYDNSNNIICIQWILPEGEGFMMHGVWFKEQCYFPQEVEWRHFYMEEMDRLRQYVDLLEKPERILGTEIFEGRECVGFEISYSKDGKKQEGRFDRIWLDVVTKLPLRIEKHGIRDSFETPGQTLTNIQDQFEYYAEVPVETFTPEIPEGFINANPYEIQAAKRKEKKREMVVAEVPPDLKKEIVGALKKVETAIYREKYEELSWGFYLSQNAWRKEYYSDDELYKTEWYVIEKPDVEKTGDELADARLRLKLTKVIQTNVDYRHKTYQIITHEYPLPWNPLHYMLFLMGFVDQADRILENEEIGEVECFGFEVRSKKYGDYPDGMKNRWWFDVKTKLPVRMELVWLENGELRQPKTIKEHFDWKPELDEETFIPKIPDGFQLIDSNGG